MTICRVAKIASPGWLHPSLLESGMPQADCLLAAERSRVLVLHAHRFVCVFSHRLEAKRQHHFNMIKSVVSIYLQSFDIFFSIYRNREPRGAHVPSTWHLLRKDSTRQNKPIQFQD